LHEWLLATDDVILNHGQVTWTTPELAPYSTTTTSHQPPGLGRSTQPSPSQQWSINEYQAWQGLATGGLASDPMAST
ncbi:hypothetical protein TNCV_1796051, partial [Trichonephila clavipes]